LQNKFGAQRLCTDYGNEWKYEYKLINVAVIGLFNKKINKKIMLGEWSMHRFYVEPANINDGRVIIEGSDVNHIKNVLRLVSGDNIVICDGQGMDYYCIISEVTKEQVIADIDKKIECKAELNNKIYLFQGLPKKDKMELIVQKSVELGVYEIIPVVMNRTIVKIDNEKKELARINRWQTIADEASKQSRRGILPQVHRLVSYKEALNMAKEMDIVILPYEKATDMSYTRKVIDKIAIDQTIGIFIGPEGGFDELEIELAEEIGCKPITLGSRILRTETAGLAIMSMLIYNLEDK